VKSWKWITKTSIKIHTYLYLGKYNEVPQGSILELVLFLWYRNDLPLNIPVAKMVLLSDDTNILVIDKDLDVLQPK
jgi:hypothetical protein